MVDLNSFSCTGRLVKDAELKTLPDSRQIVSFDIAINNGYNDTKRVLFLGVTSYSTSTVKLLPYLKKGKAVALSGDLQLNKWVSKTDGTPQQKLQMNTYSVVLLYNANQEPSKTPPPLFADGQDVEDAVFTF